MKVISGIIWITGVIGVFVLPAGFQNGTLNTFYFILGEILAIGCMWSGSMLTRKLSDYYDDDEE